MLLYDMKTLNSQNSSVILNNSEILLMDITVPINIIHITCPPTTNMIINDMKYITKRDQDHSNRKKELNIVKSQCCKRTKRNHS